jgi:hypothetical protein
MMKIKKKMHYHLTNILSVLINSLFLNVAFAIIFIVFIILILKLYDFTVQQYYLHNPFFF